jgi:hypothetical protein
MSLPTVTCGLVQEMPMAGTPAFLKMSVAAMQTEEP